MSGVNTIWCQSADVTGRDVSLSGVNPALLSNACRQASDLLYGVSGRQFPGKAQITVRPVGRPQSMTIRDWSAYLQTLSGFTNAISWAAGGGWFGSGDADYSSPNQIDLGVYPVRSVDLVKLDGMVIPPTEYRIDDYRYLVRVRPNASYQPTDRSGWPTYQDMLLPDTEPGTFSVQFTFGADPPAGGVAAATTLAVEFARMYSGQPNRLPARVQSITRQGVSMSVVDPMQYLDEGLTGVYDVDLWIRSVNPSKQKVPPAIWSPDLESRRRTGTTYP